MAEMQLKQVLSWYTTTRTFTELAISSQRKYRLLIQKGVATLGPYRLLSSVTAWDADELYAAIEDETSQHEAVAVCKVMSRVWNVAKRHDLSIINPFERMGLSFHSDREVIWTPEQVDKGIAGCVYYGLPALGMLINLCYTLGQRPGDMRQLQWDSYVDGVMRFTQEKTGAKMVIAVPELLRYELSHVARLSPYIVTREDTLKPFTATDYHPIFRDVKALAGLPVDLQIRDLRRSAATELGEGGATDSEIQSILGHKKRGSGIDILNVYQRNTPKVSENALNKRFKR